MGVFVCLPFIPPGSWSLKDFKQKVTDFVFSEAYLGRSLKNVLDGEGQE